MAKIGQQLTAPEAGWKRYDDRNFRIKFNSPATFRQSYTQYGTYLGTLSYIDSNHQSTTDTISFKFTGKKLIVGVLFFNTNEHSGFTIEVDGVNLGNYVTGAKSEITSSTVGFVKTDFSEGEHSVVIRNLDKSISNSVNSTFALDYIDIDVTGNLKVEVGEPLTSPDSGWKRIDDTDSRLLYTPSFTYSSNSNCYNGGAHQVVPNASEQTCKFRFYGTKLRLISLFYDPYPSSGVFIKIDGKAEEPIVINKPLSYQVLAYEVTGLELGYHEVVIGQHAVSGSSGGLIVDAIDIDSEGRLFHPEEVINVADLEIGKRIRCHYQSSTANAIGAFSGLGEQTSDFIPVTSSTTPNGDFYFIMVEDWNGRKQLVTDRNIQSGVSWNTINASGMVSGVSISLAGLNEMSTSIRLLTGGINSSDTINEWDKYIVNSTLNGKMTAGDNNVWNWSGIYSWTSTTNTYASNNRTVRGSSSVGFLTNTVSNNVAHGFRPLMEVTILPMYRSLFKYAETYQKYEKGNLPETIYRKINPIMTSNTSPQGVVSTSSTYNSTYEGWKAMNGGTVGADDCWATANNTPAGTLTYQFVGTVKIGAYVITFRDASDTFAAPKNWTFEGSNDGSNWTVLNTINNEAPWTQKERRVYVLDENYSYVYFRLNVTANYSTSYTAVGELELIEVITVEGKKGGWSQVSTNIPSESTFISEGISDLSVLDRKSTNFNQTMTLNGNLESGKVFKTTVDLKKNIEITSLSVK
ncbi:discoidin domain-containing protein [Paenibacillus polysaccharolyticus]